MKGAIVSGQQAEQTTIEDAELEQQVADYLRRHPGFLERRTDVLAAMQVPHITGGGALSLIEHQVRVLRKQLDSERSRLGHLISRAREYEALSARFHTLVLQLMAVTDSQHLCGLVREAMLREFHAEAVSLKLFPIGRDGDGAPDPITLAFQDFIDREHTVCGPLSAEKAGFLFGETECSIKAAALVPIRADGKSGVLAIGSTDPERFHPDMGTDFLDRLGEVVSQKLRAIHLD